MSDLKDAARQPPPQELVFKPMTAERRAQREKEEQAIARRIENERLEREWEKIRQELEEEKKVQKEVEEFRKVLKIVEEQSKVPGCPLGKDELLRLRLERSTTLAASAAASAAAVPKKEERREPRRGDPDDDPIGFMGRAVAGGVALGTTAMVLGALRND